MYYDQHTISFLCTKFNRIWTRLKTLSCHNILHNFIQQYSYDTFYIVSSINSCFRLYYVISYHLGTRVFRYEHDWIHTQPIITQFQKEGSYLNFFLSWIFQAAR